MPDNVTLDRRRRLGLCQCGNEPLPNQKLCQDCIDRGRFNSLARKVERVCQKCGEPAEPGKTCCKTHLAIVCESVKANARRYRGQVLEHYGRRCSCPGCGEDNEAFLTVDHVDGGGTQHRAKLGGSSTAVCRWIVKNNFPAGFRLLCYNCNCGRQRNGGICPHELRSAVTENKESEMSWTKGFLHENAKVLNAFPPKDTTGAAANSLWVTMKNAKRLTFIIAVGDRAGATTPDITINQATSSAGAGSKALNYDEAFIGVQSQSADALTLTASDGDSVPLSASDNSLTLISIRDDMLDINNGFQWVQCSVASPGANACPIVIIAVAYDLDYSGKPSTLPSIVV